MEKEEICISTSMKGKKLGEKRGPSIRAFFLSSIPRGFVSGHDLVSLQMRTVVCSRDTPKWVKAALPLHHPRYYCSAFIEGRAPNETITSAKTKQNETVMFSHGDV